MNHRESVQRATGLYLDTRINAVRNRLLIVRLVYPLWSSLSAGVLEVRLYTCNAENMADREDNPVMQLVSSTYTSAIDTRVARTRDATITNTSPLCVCFVWRQCHDKPCQVQLKCLRTFRCRPTRLQVWVGLSVEICRVYWDVVGRIWWHCGI